MMELHGYWQSGAVIQRNAPYCIRGWDDAADSVTVTLTRQADGVLLEQAKASVKDGRFYITMSPRQGSFSMYCLTVIGSETVQLADVCFGEVFLSSGQSNMEFSLGATSDREQAEALYHSGIRYLNNGSEQGIGPVEADRAYYPVDNPCQCGWKQADCCEHAAGMSAVSFYMAAAVLQRLHMPVGVVSTAVGGTTIETWLSRETIESYEPVCRHLQQRERYRTKENFNQAGARNYTQMTALYNERIAPYTGVAFAAVVWLLGESSAADWQETVYYGQALKLLIDSWRQLLGEDLPFFVMDIASENYQFAPMAVPYLNHALSRTVAACRRTWEIPVYDLPLEWAIPGSDAGHPIHPTAKAPYGRRLGETVVRVLEDGQQETAFPRLRECTWDGAQAILRFDGAKQGLCARDGCLRGFTLCGENGIHLEAHAWIAGCDKIVVSHPAVEKAAGVSYAYALYNQRANLTDKQGRPAIPFHVDTVEQPYYTEPREWLYLDSLTCFESCFEPALGGADAIPLWKPGHICRHGNTQVLRQDGITLVYTPCREDGYYVSLAPTVWAAGRPHHLETLRRMNITLYNPDDRDKEFIGALVRTAGGRMYMLPTIKGEERVTAQTLPAGCHTPFMIDLTFFMGCYLIPEAKEPADLSDVITWEFVCKDICEEKGMVTIECLSLGF